MVAMVRRHLPDAFCRAPRSALMAPQKEVAVEEAKQKIDRILARLGYQKAKPPRSAIQR